MAAETKRRQVVALIPARGGSKGIPGKNIRPIAGRPLIHWVLDAACTCKEIDEVYVATDDESIASVVRTYSEQVRVIGRSPETATDEAPTESVLIEFAREVDADHICLIQATSPLLRAEDLSAGFSVYFDGNYDSLVSVVRQRRFLWTVSAEGLAIPQNYDPQRRPRRQDYEGFFVENGAFYITSRRALLASGSRLSGRIGMQEMPPETYVELDEPSDWPLVETLLLQQRRNEMRWTQRLSQIKVLAMDVDGVLTDAGMYYSEAGDELKKFNTRDGMGIRLVREAGIIPVIITGERTEIVRRRAAKLGIEYVYQGVDDKLAVAKNLITELGIEWEQLAYIGDDVNDLGVLQRAGFSAAPANADEEIQRTVDYVCRAKGGHGCVRELCDLILGRTG